MSENEPKIEKFSDVYFHINNGGINISTYNHHYIDKSGQRQPSHYFVELQLSNHGVKNSVNLDISSPNLCHYLSKVFEDMAKRIKRIDKSNNTFLYFNPLSERQTCLETSIAECDNWESEFTLIYPPDENNQEKDDDNTSLTRMTPEYNYNDFGYWTNEVADWLKTNLNTAWQIEETRIPGRITSQRGLICRFEKQEDAVQFKLLYDKG